MMKYQLPEEPWEDTPQGRFPGWVWPLPFWDSSRPEWTGNEFDADHPGVDLAYLNPWGLLPQAPLVYGGIDNKKYFVPSDEVIVVSPGPGRIWFAGKTEQGYTVRIDHGNMAGFPLNTYLTHLSKLYVNEWDNKAGGEWLYAGQTVGVLGAGNTGVNHTHFEMWDFVTGPKWNRPGTPLDPKLYLPHFGIVVLT